MGFCIYTFSGLFEGEFYTFSGLFVIILRIMNNIFNFA